MGEAVAEAGNVVIIGQGTLAQAVDFDRTHGRGLQALVDTERTTYRILGYARGVVETLGPRAIGAGVRAASRGFIQGATQGDPFQQGGVLVVRAGGSPRYFYRSAFAGDHPDIRILTAELEAAIAAG
ncbi:MAG: peroxiredoxin-like family protein [Candidatus Dormibacteria bacterium]